MNLCEVGTQSALPEGLQSGVHILQLICNDFQQQFPMPLKKLLLIFYNSTNKHSFGDSQVNGCNPKSSNLFPSVVKILKSI